MKKDAADALGLGESDASGSTSNSSVDASAFRHNAENPLPHDALLIDEASLLDAPLAAALLNALKPGASLVLVGDPDQLPPVGPGAFLEDAVSSSFEIDDISAGGGEERGEKTTRSSSSSPILPRVHLSRRFRQASGSAIVDVALAAHAGRAPLPLRALSAEELLQPRKAGGDGVSLLPSEALLVVPGTLGNAGLSSSSLLLPRSYEHELRAVLTNLLPSAGFDPVSDVQVSLFFELLNFLNSFLYFPWVEREKERGGRIEREKIKIKTQKYSSLELFSSKHRSSPPSARAPWARAASARSCATC